ncbi:MAG: tRNA (adenosine(37)-N6)-threonylcarbamoyltransferase complex transferase subunit TsaD [Candidatus Doudnabacteria bacterium RIFCSPHIGHO2_01_FULL_46_14]|uniref:tRNA N6-adenosine threonylcarbamoyltransferase n=1 Tax=Candidatus Doudnabacteria bacterium RIFCSPHIGHO2_01_FULL_46_14 TaxID=1817824 RepID=A0A1F5NK43_9BACT|nr:MAG: tRNA (adenosine(37)-N6)-threonylcarbamoyltransferase complex transferase subunit TsaD [Candidatus Doudnabacteria bacterium RIFCSPHIGHO2_01_FULL_46_14]
MNWFKSGAGVTHILAIESSADETSAAVLEGETKSRKFRLLSNIIYSQINIHQKTGGIVPEVAARNHILKILPVIAQALAKAGVQLKDINAIAVTAGPGLVTSLMIGVDTAKALAFALQIPILPINHMEGHLLSALANESPPPLSSPLKGEEFPSLEGRGKGRVKFPALGLVVSGGHTMLVLVEKIGKYKILGETVDDAAGECFDKVAKIMGLPYPGGPEISKLAKKGKPQAFDFPRPMMDSKNYDFSFSGLKTAVLYHWQSLLVANRQSQVANVAASVEQAIVDVLVSKTIRSAKQYKVKTILLGGGVSANEKLRKQLASAIKKSLPHSTFHIPHSNLTTDNAGMITMAAFYQYSAGNRGTPIKKIKVNPNWELRSWK